MADPKKKKAVLSKQPKSKSSDKKPVHVGVKRKKKTGPQITYAMNMKKQYKVKDINNNGKIDGWEQGKYDAINSATKMKKNYSMKMGSKEINSPTNFSSKSAMMMSKSPMYKLKDPYKGGDPNSFENNMSKYLKSEPKIDQSASMDLDNVTVVEKALTPSEKLAAGKKRKADGKAVIKNARKEIRAERKSNRKARRVKRLENRRDLQEFKGKQKLAAGDKVGAEYKVKRINRINKRIAKNK